jgi:hypothetical protein
MLRQLRAGGSEFTQMPLYTRKLINFETLVRADSYPGDNEAMYYYIRQSSALIDYISQNGALAFLAMSESLSNGQRFEKAFDDTYVEVRDDLSGKAGADNKNSKKSDRMSREEKRQARKEEKDRKEKADTAEDILNGYKELRRNAEDVIFVPLTFEYLKGTMSDKKPLRPKRPKQPGRPGQPQVPNGR